MQKQHLLYIDVLKGFAILLVVMGHVLAWQFENFSQVDDSKVLFLWHAIYSFHMPLFFFVSGFLFSRSNFDRKETSAFIWKKIKTLLFPFVTMGILIYLIRDKAYNYWFLRSLLEFTLLSLPFEVFRKERIQYHKSYYSAVYYLFVYVLLVILSHFMDQTTWYAELLGLRPNFFLFFSLGIISQRTAKIQRLLDSNIIFTLCLFGYSVCLFVENRFTIILVALFAIGACWYLFKNVYVEGSIINKVSILGKYSLEIYLLHFFFSISIPQIGTYWLEKSQVGGIRMLSVISEQLVFSILVSLVIIILSLSFANVINKSKILSILLLGRTSKL